MPTAPTPAEVGVVIARLLDGARRPAVVVTDLDVHVEAADTVVRRVGEALPEGQVRTVLLVTADVETLRTDASRAAHLRWARMVGVVVVDAVSAPTLRPHPSWPAVHDLDARLVGGIASTRLDFAARLEVEPVLMAFARDAAAPVLTGPGGLRVAGAVAPPADPSYAAAYDVDDERPADVVLVDGSVEGPDLEPSPVTGRAPLRLSALEAGTPLDEAIYCPTGFRREWTRPMLDLPGDTTLTPALVRGLRDAQGVRLGPDAAPRLVAGLAMCGIPTVRLDDPDERERHSVRTRRAALLTHSATAWRALLAERAGVRFEQQPGEVTVTTGVPDEVTDLRLALRYSGADLVVLPDDDVTGETERFVATSRTPPPGAMIHARDRTPEQVVAAGGLVYVARPRSVR